MRRVLPAILVAALVVIASAAASTAAPSPKALYEALLSTRVSGIEPTPTQPGGVSKKHHVGPRGHEGRRPALLDPALLPDERRHGPGDHEEADDAVAHVAEVEPLEPAEEAGGQVELRGHHLQQLDRPDRERDGHRQARD